MRLVVDANVIIAMLIRPGKPVDLFFREEIELFAPQLLIEEIERNRGIILAKSYLKDEEVGTFLAIVRQRMTIVPESAFVKFREQAEAICPDKKDTTYFALALFLQCPLWTSEKALRNQPSVIVYTTHELLRLFGLSR